MENTPPGFVVIGDSHIVSDFENSKLTNAHDSLFALTQAVDYCLEHHLPLVLAGDLYDRNMVHSRMLKRVALILNRLHADGLGLYGIQGNHDKDPEFPWFAHCDGAIQLGPSPVLVGGHRLAGLDFAPSADIGERLEHVQPCDGLVLHQAARQGLGFEDAWNFDLDWIGDHTSCVWMGDLHKVYKELWSSDKRVRAVYTGSQYMTRVEESSTPSFIRVGPVDTHPTYERIPLQHRPIHQFVVDDDASFEQMIEQVSEIVLDVDPRLPEAVRTPGLIVTYYADMPGVTDVLNELTTGGKARVYEKMLPSRQQSFATWGKTAGDSESVTLEKLVAESTEGQLQAFMFDLARCQSVDAIRDTLEAWKKRIYEKDAA